MMDSHKVVAGNNFFHFFQFLAHHEFVSVDEVNFCIVPMRRTKHNGLFRGEDVLFESRKGEELKNRGGIHNSYFLNIDESCGQSCARLFWHLVHYSEGLCTDVQDSLYNSP